MAHLPILRHAVVRSAACALAVVVATAACAHAWLLFGARDEQDARRLEGLVRQGAAQLRDDVTAAADPAGPDGGTPLARRFRDWAWSVLQEDHVISASLSDAQGRVVFSLPPRAALTNGPTSEHEGGRAELVTLNVDGAPATVWQAAASLAGDRGDLVPARLVLLARHRPWRGQEVGRLVGFAAALLAVSVVILMGFAAWFDRRMRKPLLALGGLQDKWRDPTRPALPVERTDEVGAAARCVEGLVTSLRAAEEESDRLQQTMHRRVADQTRQINAMLRRAERAAWLDPLTGLGNRRLLEERLEKLFEVQCEQGGDLSIVMLDLDHFKRLNDSQGHSAGDELLRFVGELLRGALRHTDLGIRYGGDEFALILPDTAPGPAARIAERIVRLFGQRCSVMRLEPPVSLSAGVASLLRNRPESSRQLLEQADQALYAAKARGKNVLCTMAE